MGKSVKEIATAWFYRLPFAEEHEAAFVELLEKKPELPVLRIEEFETVRQTMTHQTMLVYCLFFHEELLAWHQEHNIPEAMFSGIMSDIVVNAERCIEGTGKLGLEPDLVDWMLLILNKKLFRFKRYFFEMSKAVVGADDLGIQKGEPVVDIHIPGKGKLDIDLLQQEMKEAEAFFKVHFPDFTFRYFSCYSWLLDDSLDDFLPEHANIIQFRKLFHLLKKEKSDDIFKFMYRFRMKSRAELQNWHPTSSFAEKVKAAGLSGREFYKALGVIDKKQIYY